MSLPKKKTRVLPTAIVAALCWVVAFDPGTAMSDHPFPRRVKVDPLPDGLVWVNTAKPPKLEDFRGKFVRLDFWTYCCINCMHTLPELKKLERAYPNNLVVIGVHSAKFATEEHAKNVAEAVERYKIEHPVVNDPKHLLWDRFTVRSWPTLILIDPRGEAVWGKPGESTFEELDAVMKRGLPFYRRHNLLDEKPLRLDLTGRRPADSPLWFPGKVLADETGQRLFIADSGHNRIVVSRPDGSVLATIGAGTAGRTDGDYATAEFNAPQGMALHGQMLYVADTENHLIRRVDLKRQQVQTVAGTGTQLRGFWQRESRLPATRTAIASPWALWIHGDEMFVAMAGPHQIWRMWLTRDRIAPYAGNRREDIVDGPLLPQQPYQLGFSSFAQPSGLASDGTRLFVADSEGSSIRSVPLDGQGRVTTLVGTSRLPAARLFTFGDVDGPAAKVRLQHPLGVHFYDGKLYVADTYNNKIKVINPRTGTTQTLAGTGEAGANDSDDGLAATFDEPCGLCAAGGKLYVADTNNHALRVIDLQDGNRVSTLTLPRLKGE